MKTLLYFDGYTSDNKMKFREYHILQHGEKGDNPEREYVDFRVAASLLENNPFVLGKAIEKQPTGMWTAKEILDNAPGFKANYIVGNESIGIEQKEEKEKKVRKPRAKKTTTKEVAPAAEVKKVGNTIDDDFSA